MTVDSKDSKDSKVSGGLYEGFEGYRSHSDEELRGALRTALVVLDTNVLLNLYRYNAEARASIVDVMAALGDRLWIPHQVLEEFWRNRERALVSPLAEVSQSSVELDKHLSAARDTLRFWVNRAALTADVSAYVEDRLTDAFEAAQTLLDGLLDEAGIQRARNTQHDPVLVALERVLDGHVGLPMSDDSYSKALAEGKRRSAAGEPPGFADAKKADRNEEGATGDYLVWEQLLLEVERRHVPVVFVTGDVKRDWWRYEGSFARGPRTELTRELEGRCGTRLYMMRPDTLLSLADALAVSVRPESVEDVERTSRSNSTESSTVDSTGWTAEALRLLLTRLAGVGPVQEATIRLASQQDGYVSRDEVYQLGDYEPERQLKGFTRPVNRLVQALRDSGDLPEDAVDALLPVYDEMSRGFGWVDGFRVPDELVRLLRDM